MNVGNDFELIPRKCSAKRAVFCPMLQTPFPTLASDKVFCPTLQTPFPKIASDKDQFLQGLMGVATARNKTKISVEKKCEPSYGFGPQTISWKFNRAK